MRYNMQGYTGEIFVYIFLLNHFDLDRIVIFYVGQKKWPHRYIEYEYLLII